MSDFAPFRRADETGFTDTIWREIVVQHERLFALAFDRIDDLRIPSRAERRDHQRLGFAASEQCRAVSPRQYADFDGDRTHGLVVAAVNARFADQHPVTDDALLEAGQAALTSSSGQRSPSLADDRLDGRFLRFRHARLALHLVRYPVGCCQCVFAPRS